MVHSIVIIYSNKINPNEETNTYLRSTLLTNQLLHQHAPQGKLLDDE